MLEHIDKDAGMEFEALAQRHIMCVKRMSEKYVL